MRAFSEAEVQQALQKRKFWHLEGGQIVRTWKWKNFLESIEFVKKVAVKAEQLNHHPDILIRYNQVTLSLNTHDLQGISEKDFQLAEICDGLS